MVMKKNLILSLLLIAPLVVAQNAAAAVTWDRGDPGSTYQIWDFDNDTNPSPADNPEGNSWGAATAQITASGEIYGFAAGWYDNFLGRQGVWSGESIDVDLAIPNTDQPNDYKDIWLKAEFRGDVTNYFVTPDPRGTVTELGYSVTNTPDGWRILEIGWRIEPNPNSEDISLGLLSCGGSNLNYIEVDTICIPEPMSVALLAAAIPFLRKRKKKI